MTATETLAAELNGRQYGNEITREEAEDARINGLIVAFGYSDDNIEFRGVLKDEVGCYERGSFDITKSGKLIPDHDEDDQLSAKEWREFEALKAEGFRTVEAFFDKDGYSWIFKTDIPHATFEIMEDGEKFCRGIVFAISDL